MGDRERIHQKIIVMHDELEELQVRLDEGKFTVDKEKKLREKVEYYKGEIFRLRELVE